MELVAWVVQPTILWRSPLSNVGRQLGACPPPVPPPPVPPSRPQPLPPLPPFTHTKHTKNIEPTQKIHTHVRIHLSIQQTFVGLCFRKRLLPLLLFVSVSVFCFFFFADFVFRLFCNTSVLSQQAHCQPSAHSLVCTYCLLTAAGAGGAPVGAATTTL